ncbi:MAG: shikimate dehydrogenase [Planctomycetes bacterium]|nr:shikimate dehydrogenase [Planctomycetota bacterium]
MAHSLSPRLHNALFRRAGLDAVYLPLRTADPRRLLAEWREDLGLAGLSITRPHKEAMAALVDAISPEARDLGAVNTVVIHLAGEDRRQVGRGPSRLGCHRQEGGGTVVVERGRATGYNTDLPAARLALEDLCRAAGLDPEGLRVLVLGAGGVARALAHAAAGLGARLTVAARDPRRARALAERFGGVGVALGDAGEARAQLVANATPVGMSPFEEAVPVPVDVVAEAVAALDAVYAPPETRFLREARAAGCRVTGGMVLFVHQARRQFELWTGLAPTDEELREALETGGG